MATVNKRTYQPRSLAINGIDAGGLMSARISEGYDQILRSSPDGLQLPVVDREIQFCRGSIVSQDWVEMITLLTGTLGTKVFYERKSGMVETAGFIKHTITAPVIYQAAIDLSSGDKGGYGTVSADYECKAADVDKGVADMHAMADANNAPTYIAAARGGHRILTTLHGAVAIYHVTRLSVRISIPLKKACNDGDVGYTCVDVDLSGLSVTGSISFQDSTITSAKLKCQDLLLAARANLVATIRQGSAATNKVLTLAGVIFGPAEIAPSVNSDFSEYTLPFEVTNNTTTQLTLAGANKIITIADAV